MGIIATAWSTALNFGSQHAWAWITEVTWPGLGLGTGLALVACLLPRRVNAALGLVVLTALIAIVTQAPEDPYLALSLSAWERGRFINLYGIAQWLGWIWPFAALAWLFWGVAQRE